jgi:hypothetical protein
MHARSRGACSASWAVKCLHVRMGPQFLAGVQYVTKKIRRVDGSLDPKDIAAVLTGPLARGQEPQAWKCGATRRTNIGQCK